MSVDLIVHVLSQVPHLYMADKLGLRVGCGFCHPDSHSSSRTTRQMLPLNSIHTSFVCVFVQFFFFFVAGGTLEILCRICQILNSGQAGLSSMGFTLCDTPDLLFLNQQLANSADHYGSSWRSCLQLHLRGHH
ncbi:hypothetical protein XENORESO_008173 [Xenotaenia resolanae]|uniref:Uncharacterized protein n=1 Tax=Xenotaenia resolanae TaxID=208358 RepID=A0ABV0WW30_9TELE